MLTPWNDLLAVIAPVYPKGHRGRPPIRLEVMLRMYLAQQCLGLSDEGIEDALYDSQAIRRFVGIDLGRESAPDSTMLLKFRHLLEDNALTAGLFAAVNRNLSERGLLLRQETVVDAIIIAAPPSTKNRKKARDPEMHQTKKGNQWFSRDRRLACLGRPFSTRPQKADVAARCSLPIPLLFLNASLVTSFFKAAETFAPDLDSRNSAIANK